MSAYASVAEANAYFDTRLYSDLWNTQSVDTKTKALETATRMIDRLNFAGEKHAANLVRLSLTGSSNVNVWPGSDSEIKQIFDAGLGQELEFPRGADTVIPTDIKTACYEIAFALLDGVDPEAELDDLGVVSQGYSSVRTTYDRTSVPQHHNAGIPSAVAWRFLKPYLQDGRAVKISRV